MKKTSRLPVTTDGGDRDGRRRRPRRSAGHGRAATGGGTGPRGDARRGRAAPRRAAEQSRAATAGGDDGWRRPLLSGSRDARQKQRRPATGGGGTQQRTDGRTSSRGSQNEHPAARSDWIRAGGQQTATGRPAAELNSRSGGLSEP